MDEKSGTDRREELDMHQQELYNEDKGRKGQKKMDKEWEAVRLFHRKFNHPVGEKPGCMGRGRAQKRYNWMQEEIDEFLEAVEEGDIVEQADAMIDVIYFALGTLVEMGIRPDALFEIVQRANMGKLWPDGKPHYAEDGKTLKPDTWKDPHEELKKAIQEMDSGNVS